ncbi:membrane-associated guanylate kinase, WW and PDZ domain-containing protein 3-like isoform X1 [Anguilla rostrata]|uniref:membrane-associated guanylate kinase, WW and PDZ domain-containing protein 3-like isoform X1 n=2 Tax=Anguilla rostrata TaxID=7938 RepID=UPI0030D01E36
MPDITDSARKAASRDTENHRKGLIMSKTLKKKKHWSSKVQECAISWGNGRELSSVVEVMGGAELGEFPYLGQVKAEAMACQLGRIPCPGDVLLEVNGTPVSGLTNRDTLAVIRHFREPIRLKTVKPGKVLNTDLRHYLSLQFQKGSLDHRLQQVIRDNLYLRTIPCTTRLPREGEVPGVDYSFISVEEFRILEESGLLLESGTYDGNYYGTPKPPAEPSPIQLDLVDQVLFDEQFGTEVHRKRTTSVSKMDRTDSTAPEEEDDEERPAILNGLSDQQGGAEWRRAVPGYPQGSRAVELRSWSSLPRDGSPEPLPKNWEMAYTDTGMVYFIDHNNKTTTWLDPRLAKRAKPPEKCEDGELPYGWEQIEDPHYGIYYVDHINQKTQFENPVLEAKKKLSQQEALPAPEERGVRGFTRNPSQLKGVVIRTALRKSSQGFGFTIIGGDRSDEFLQVKNVLRDGPAAQDKKLASGDVIVEINGTCVLGMTHATVVQMFQAVPVHQCVDMVVCRGYPLPEDVGSDDEDGGGQVTVINGQPLLVKGEALRGSSQELPYVVCDDGAAPPNGPAPSLLQPELVSVALVKGPGGFGFAIADCPLGQKVKMILDAQWCRGLLKGDVIKEINRQNVQTLSHAQVVDILKDLPVGREISVLVLRGGQTSPVKSLKPKPEMTASTETLDRAPDSTAHPLPLPPSALRSSAPKPDPAEFYPTTPRSSAPRSDPIEFYPTTPRSSAPRSDRTEFYPTTPRSSAPRSDPAEFYPSTPRSSAPKPDPTELYIKSKALQDSKPANTRDLDVFIKRNQESGFGFRVLGGEGPEQPVYIGSIVPLGAAQKDGRLRAGDELIGIDGVLVKGQSHKQVLDLMTNAARNGQVLLTVRRKVTHTDGGEEDLRSALVNGSPRLPRIEVVGLLEPKSYDITLQRQENEGFGFVILTSKSKPPPGVIPHKIGRIIEGSPAGRCGRLRVGDRICAVNGQPIVALEHSDIVQLIKEAGYAVTLTVVPADEYNGPPSGNSTAKNSPAPQHRTLSHRDDRYTLDMEESRDVLTWADYKTLPQPEQGTLCIIGPNPGCFLVELSRGPRGFGFSLRGGQEYNMGLFILRLAEDGAALQDGRIKVGDQIVEINGEPTQGITHTRAIELIQAGGSKVLLLLRPGPGHGQLDRTPASPPGCQRQVSSLSVSTACTPLPPASPAMLSLPPSQKPPSSRWDGSGSSPLLGEPRGCWDRNSTERGVPGPDCSREHCPKLFFSPASPNLNPASPDISPSSTDLSPAPSHHSPASSDLSSALSDLSPAPSHHSTASSDLSPTTSDLSPASSDLSPASLDLGPAPPGPDSAPPGPDSAPPGLSPAPLDLTRICSSKALCTNRPSDTGGSPSDIRAPSSLSPGWGGAGEGEQRLGTQPPPNKGEDTPPGQQPHKHLRKHGSLPRTRGGRRGERGVKLSREREAACEISTEEEEEEEEEGEERGAELCEHEEDRRGAELGQNGSCKDRQSYSTSSLDRKLPVTPGPWKIPSSARILTREEVMREPY